MNNLPDPESSQKQYGNTKHVFSFSQTDTFLSSINNTINQTNKRKQFLLRKPFKVEEKVSVFVCFPKGSHFFFSSQLDDLSILSILPLEPTIKNCNFFYFEGFPKYQTCAIDNFVFYFVLFDFDVYEEEEEWEQVCVERIQLLVKMFKC